jgi:hypothetical protein
LQVALVLAFWALICIRAPRFFAFEYLPGYLAGLGLCALHGYYEHARGTTSHYGALYNFLVFNDGYHAEHHANPAIDWTHLPARLEPGARASRWPAPLRWMEVLNLEGMERLVLRSPVLQRFVLRSHTRAFRKLMEALPQVESVAIVGGGVFPRTALVLQELLPAAKIRIIDADGGNLEQARDFIKRRWCSPHRGADSQPAMPPFVATSARDEGTPARMEAWPARGPLHEGSIEFVRARYIASQNSPCDLLVIPLSFVGDREAIYARPPAAAVIVHDWIWRRRGRTCVVSVLMLKRLNLVKR